MKLLFLAINYAYSNCLYVTIQLSTIADRLQYPHIYAGYQREAKLSS